MKKKNLLLIITLLLFPAISLRAAEPDMYKFWLPDNNWAFELDISGFEIELQQIRDDIKGRFCSANDNEHQIVLSLFMEPVPPGITPEAYRDSLAELGSKEPFPIENDTRYEIENTAIQEYVISVMNQWHLYAFMVKDSVGINLHLSSMNPKEDILPYVNNVLESMNIIENYDPTSFDYFIFGSWCYNKDNFKPAIRFYSRALEKEKQNKVMPRTYWLVLVDNLGMSYGLSGDPDKAQEIFEYGLSEEPTYPMFYYNLACAYAEKKELDSALAVLEKAYLYEENMIPGEEIPDPYHDNSFKRYWNNKKFQASLEKFIKDKK